MISSSTALVAYVPGYCIAATGKVAAAVAELPPSGVAAVLQSISNLGSSCCTALASIPVASQEIGFLNGIGTMAIAALALLHATAEGGALGPIPAPPRAMGFMDGLVDGFHDGQNGAGGEGWDRVFDYMNGYSDGRILASLGDDQ